MMDPQANIDFFKSFKGFQKKMFLEKKYKSQIKINFAIFYSQSPIP